MIGPEGRRKFKKALQALGRAQWKDIFVEKYLLAELRQKDFRLFRRALSERGMALRVIKDGKQWIRCESSIDPGRALFLAKGEFEGEEREVLEEESYLPPIAFQTLADLADRFEEAEVLIRRFYRKVLIFTPKKIREKEEELYLLKLREKDVEEVWSGDSFSPPLDFIVSEFEGKREERKEARELPSEGEFLFYLAPGEGGVLFHELVGHMVELDNVMQGRSLFSFSDVGQTIFPEDFNLTSFSQVPDDDGTPPSRVRVVERGRLRTFLSSRFTSLLTGQPLTSSSRRQRYYHTPVVSSGNLLIEGGRYEPFELLSEVKRGVYVAEFRNGDVNPSEGWAYFRVSRAYWVEDGKPRYPLKPFIMAVSFDQFSSLRLEREGVRDKGGLFCHKKGQVFSYTVESPGCLLQAFGVRQ